MRLINTLLLRIIFICSIVTFSVLILLSISPAFVSSFSDLIEQNFGLRLIVGIFGSITGLGMFYLWGYMIYHWGTSSFKDRKGKFICFWFISLGMFLGAAIYYVLVYENKLFLEK